MKRGIEGSHESMLEYADRISNLYSQKHDANIRKKKGQVLTPGNIANFMVELFHLDKDKVRLLDPGAGTGVLTAAFCDKVAQLKRPVNLTIDAYENDKNILPYLEKVLCNCKSVLEGKGHHVSYNILATDFILDNHGHINKLSNNSKLTYDYIISNPPYFKLNKTSPQSEAIASLISGQPNIYILFMAKSTSMLSKTGEMVFITPRSFCSGSYYKKFRKWFIDNAVLTNIHIFESRKELFNHDSVLQENIIIKAKPPVFKLDNQQVIITMSKNGHFNDVRQLVVSTQDIIHRRNGDMIIRIPTSPLDLKIIKEVDGWPMTLMKLGLQISTGPVVDFRAKEYLLPQHTKHPASAPLLWMHNMENMKTIWPLNKKNKASAIRITPQTKKLLLPSKNYALVKRFSSKEQMRRLYAAVLLQHEFPYDYIGLENHVNYIYRPEGNLSVEESYGIAGLLNTSFIDNYFRSLNGNTQVNASDIRSLPFPDLVEIRKIGNAITQARTYENGINLDYIVGNILGFDKTILEKLNGATNDQN